MLRHLIHKEIVENVSGPKFLISFLICTVLILTSLWTGYQLYEIERSWYVTAVNENSNTLINLGSYALLTTEGAKVTRPPTRLSIFVRGVDSTVGKAASVSARPEVMLRDSRFGLNPIFAVFGELDLAFIVKIILSLFALLFSYNAISGERELGTLKQVLSNSISRAGFIVGKTIGGLVTLLIPFLVPLLMALLILLIGFGVSFSADEWLRIGMITLVFCLYLAVFYMIGMFMSSLTRNSTVSFLLCLVVWVLSIAVLPKAAVEIAGQLSPAPSIDALEAQLATLRRDYYAQFRALATDKVSALVASGVEEYGELALALDEAESETKGPMEERIEAIVMDYERRQLALLNTAENLARVSPTACVTFATSRLAHTSARLRERFLEALRRYKVSFLDFAAEKIESNPEKTAVGVGFRVHKWTDEETGQRVVRFNVEVPEFALNLSGMPSFKIEQESAEDSVIQILPDIAILAIEVLAFLAAAFVAFIRYDVRQ